MDHRSGEQEEPAASEKKNIEIRGGTDFDWFTAWLVRQ
jgi:hypothetical protein